MKKGLLLFLFIIPLIFAQAQNTEGERVVQKVNMALGVNNDGVKHKVMYFQVPFKERTTFATIAFKFYGIPQESMQIEIAYANKAGIFTDYKVLKFDDHIPSDAAFIVTQMEEISPEYERLRVRISTPIIKKFKSEAHWYLPPTEYSLTNKILPQARLDENCILPSYVTRTGWSCPSGQAFTGGTPTFTDVSHIAVHHTAGVNTSSNWAARVLAVWDYHVNTNDYSDIAYNFLIDPNGVIYEGRGGNEGYTKDVLSAATCGSNNGSMAICMMGNFEDVEPTPAAIASLESLLAWKADDKGIDPIGSSSLNNYGVLDHIFGHRQGCATACPGQNLYDDLPTIRAEVGALVASGCTEGTPSIATGELTIDDNNDGDSEGNEDGSINQGETIEMYLTITNDGDVPLTNVSATISTNNACVTYVDDNIDFGNVAVGAEVTEGDFDVVFSPTCPTGPMEFTITYTFDGGTITETITLNIEEAPCPKPEVDFVANVTSGPSPLIVEMQNNTTNALEYEWSVSGPTNLTSEEENPTFTLVEAGIYQVLLTAYNECGSNSLVVNDYIQVFEVTGLSDDNLLVASIYPNPVKRKLNIALKQVVNSANIRIINSVGQEIYNSSFSGNSTQVNVKDLSSGTYILQIIDNAHPEKIYTHTFVKKS